MSPRHPTLLSFCPLPLPALNYPHLDTLRLCWSLCCSAESTANLEVVWDSDMMSDKSLGTPLLRNTSHADQESCLSEVDQEKGPKTDHQFSALFLQILQGSWEGTLMPWHCLDGIMHVAIRNEERARYPAPGDSWPGHCSLSAWCRDSSGMILAVALEQRAVREAPGWE